MINQLKNVRYFSELSFLKINKQLKIGVFGGSFNPPHLGHLYIAKTAIKKLKLDFIILMITPQNPNKKNIKTYSLSQRVSLCKALCKNNPKIKIITLEESMYLHYTYLSMVFINKFINNQTQLFWIMGEDNLTNFHLFKYWKNIAISFNVAVFARSKISVKSLYSKSSIFYKNQKINKLKFFLMPKNKLSSTQIRNNTKESIIE
jgi:nicotinate-nucleotide adenylyltransferase